MYDEAELAFVKMEASRALKTTARRQATSTIFHCRWYGYALRSGNDKEIATRDQ